MVAPSIRITVRPLLYEFRQDPTHAGDIEIARCLDGKHVQTLDIEAWQPINFGATFVARDINFDGFKDIAVLAEFAAKFGSLSYWVYDPGSGTFIQNELTRELSENCLGRDWHGACWKSDSIDFDAAKREITVHYLIGVGQCGSPVDRYRIENGRLRVVHKAVVEMNPESCTVTIWDLVGNEMRVTTVQRFDGNGELLRPRRR